MPRLSTSLLIRARHIDPLLTRLLRVTRDLPSARNELRWLSEHVFSAQPNIPPTLARAKLSLLCQERSRGRPLQYILGSEFFGDLEIQCRNGVFIPRQETAEAVSYLVTRLLIDGQLKQDVRVLDICAGTGAMSLLFAYLWSLSNELKSVDILGVDISQKAAWLANHNTKRLRGQNLLSTRVASNYIESDIFSPDSKSQRRTIQEFDIILCNPPYISKRGFWHDTTRSVRMHEPMRALIPTPEQGLSLEHPEDAFYHEVLNSDIKAKVVLFEVAHMEQANRIAQLGLGAGWKCEIWRDLPSVDSLNNDIPLPNVSVRGSGQGRSVYLWRE